MEIDRAAFGEVFVVSFGAAVGVMVLFAVGVTRLAGRTPVTGGPQDGGGAGAAARATAGLCFLACALVVYGLCIIVS